MNTNFHHISVLLYECIDALHIRNGYTYVDCTTGSGSHSFQIAKRMGEDSRLICIDRDINAIEAAVFYSVLKCHVPTALVGFGIQN